MDAVLKAVGAQDGHGFRLLSSPHVAFVDRQLLEVMNFLFRLLMLWPHVDITKTIDGEKVLYLRRWFLWRNKWWRKIGLHVNWGNLYLHKIVRSDDDPDPHDHPWSFASLVFKGGYFDEQYLWNAPYSFSWDKARIYQGLRLVRPFMIVRRRAEHIHRVILTKDYTDTENPITIPSWSLVATGPYRRNWSFITERGPILWWTYLGVKQPANPLDDLG